ncbi:hypothetical protein FRC17_001835 [Serendipita sp. 399]|nr:hypothetical protein FRC17_001835 [Serendipita sp. 399]
METFLQVLFARLPERDQTAFFNLQNCKSATDTGPLLGRLLTNGVTFSPYPTGPNHAGVFPTLARCNHSCGPNALARFNHNTWAIELRATRVIKAGEEILISYVDVLQESTKRSEQLTRGYNFTCRCLWCGLPQSKLVASNTRRMEIASWLESKPIFRALQGDSDAISSVISHAQEEVPQAQDEVMGMIAKVVTATREGLEPLSLLVVKKLFQAYAHQGDEKSFRKWRGSFRDLSLAVCGETADTDSAEREIVDPASTVPYWGDVKLSSK